MKNNSVISSPCVSVGLPQELLFRGISLLDGSSHLLETPLSGWGSKCRGWGRAGRCHPQTDPQHPSLTCAVQSEGSSFPPCLLQVMVVGFSVPATARGCSQVALGADENIDLRIIKTLVLRNSSLQ